MELFRLINSNLDDMNRYRPTLSHSDRNIRKLLRSVYSTYSGHQHVQNRAHVLFPRRRYSLVMKGTNIRLINFTCTRIPEVQIFFIHFKYFEQRTASSSRHAR